MKTSEVVKQMMGLMNESNLEFVIESCRSIITPIKGFQLSKSSITGNILWFYTTDSSCLIQVHAETIPSIKWNGHIIPLYRVDADQNWEPLWEYFGDDCLDIKCCVQGAMINSPFKGVILDVTDDKKSKVDVLNLDTKDIYTLEPVVKGHIYIQK